MRIFTRLLLWDYLVGSFLNYSISVLMTSLTMVWAGKELGRWKRHEKNGAMNKSELLLRSNLDTDLGRVMLLLVI